jgi:crotonobetainyl-CoA hydratase
MSAAVVVQLTGHTLVVTINRPTARNAVDVAVWEGLGAAFERAETDPHVRSVVLTGAGDLAFCAGLDLKSLACGEFQQRFAPTMREESWGFAGVASHEISTPIIAAVNGVAMGGGWEIVLSCDLVVAADSARFGLPEVQRGLIAGGGGAFRLSRELPRPLAMELLLTGDSISAARALELGMANAVVPPEQLMTTALALAERVNRNAPVAVQATKRIARGIVGGKVAADECAWLLSADEVRRVMRSADAAEGPRAFVEKRAPVWQGR